MTSQKTNNCEISERPIQRIEWEFITTEIDSYNPVIIIITLIMVHTLYLASQSQVLVQFYSSERVY